MLASLLMLAAADLGAQARSFAYAVTDIYGDVVFNWESENPRDSAMLRYQVQYDSQKRIISYTEVVDGRIVRTVRFRYSAGPRPVSYDVAGASGKLGTRVNIRRDANGQIVRLDEMSATGKLLGYSTRAYAGDSAVRISFDPQGTVLRRTIDFFTDGPYGNPKRLRRYVDDSTYYEDDIHPYTGLKSYSRKFQSGELVAQSRYSYDSTTHVLTRIDAYTADDKWFGRMEYEHGLQVRRTFKGEDGTTRESRTRYNDRTATETVFEVNGNLVSTLKYERDDNGYIIRTIAVAPDGSVMAEYPGLLVREVERNGDPLDHEGIATIHKKGPWW